MPSNNSPVSTGSMSGPALQAEMQWLSQVIEARFKTYFQQGDDSAAEIPPPPALASSPFASFVNEFVHERDDRVLLALALAPHLAPQRLDPFLLQNTATGRGYSEFGGVESVNHNGFLPTGETALFLLASDDIETRLAAAARLQTTRPLFAGLVLQLSAPAPGEPTWSGTLSLVPGAWSRMVGGEKPSLPPGMTELTTPLEWADLVLPDETISALAEITAWAEHEVFLRKDWGLDRRIGPGFRVLFHGSAGTGRTLAATLLGKKLGKQVARVDLTRLVSDSIVETESSIDLVFNHAAHSNLIIFIEETASLFGKPTAQETAGPGCSHHGVACLARRLATHPGIVIASAIQSDHLDHAFLRHFHSRIHFPVPDADLRLRLWRSILGEKIPLAANVDLPQLAIEHEVTGGQIINAVRRVCLHALLRAERDGDNPDFSVHQSDFLSALRPGEFSHVS